MPKDMHDLEAIYYTQQNAERKRKYESFVDSQIIDATREAEAKRILKNFGQSVKIPRGVTKSPDFEIDESRIVYEITSVQCSEEERISQRIEPRGEQDFVNDVNTAIEHALEKDYSQFCDYLRIVLVFIDTIMATLCHYTLLSATPPTMRKTIFSHSDIDCIIVIPLPSSISKELPHVAYTKEANTAKLLREKLPQEFRINII